MKNSGRKPGGGNTARKTAGRPDKGPLPAGGKGTRLPPFLAERPEIRERAWLIGEIRESVRALPEVRVEKVRALRRAIESGTYVVDSLEVAKKMIDEAL